MIVPVAMCRTLLTVPPFPWPRSLKTSRSSLFRSSLYSIPISSCAVCLVLSLPTPPGIWRSLSEGATARGAGAAKASPFTFFRFRVRTAPMFSDILGYWSAHRTRAEDLRAGRRGQEPPTRGRCRGDTIAVEAGCRSRSSGVSISGPSQRAASLLSVEMGEPRQRARGSVGVSAGREVSSREISEGLNKRAGRYATAGRDQCGVGGWAWRRAVEFCAKDQETREGAEISHKGAGWRLPHITDEMQKGVSLTATNRNACPGRGTFVDVLGSVRRYRL